MSRRILPILAAALAFLAAVALVQPEPSVQVVVAAADLPAGRTLTEADLRLEEVPERLAPSDALGAVEAAVGQRLRVDRAAGDVIRAAHLGEPVTLGPGERAVAVRVRDSAGLAGLLRPGDVVGVVAVIQVQNPGAPGGAFSKATIEPLRVLYLSPEFQAQPAATPAVDPVTGLARVGERRQAEGTVVLAVPTRAQVVLYDFSGLQAPNAVRQVNALELLAALDAADNATLSLYLLPEEPAAFTSAGLFLPDLVITPGPTPTPAGTAQAAAPEAEP